MPEYNPHPHGGHGPHGRVLGGHGYAGSSRQGSMQPKGGHHSQSMNFIAGGIAGGHSHGSRSTSHNSHGGHSHSHSQSVRDLRQDPDGYVMKMRVISKSESLLRT